MPESQSVAEGTDRTGLLVLGVDTCGSTGSVALARVEGGTARILGQTELAGRSYSATLVAAIKELVTASNVRLGDLRAIVVVNGPGSFTGVRVGLSAVKGLAEPGKIPVVAVSRLAVLAAKAGVGAAALDAHRHEVFLRLEEGGEVRELLAGPEELAREGRRTDGLGRSPVPKSEGPFDRLRAGSGAPNVVAVCEETAAEMVSAAFGGAELARIEAPTAGDAIQVCLPRILNEDFDDVALLDGHYLRRSDAEIFGDTGKRA
ncbi:MAG TPA: tRNA (adenosine(37)-N6)-threonylcarbamoyltransferase complex dimerization subunit type 1 TsaB [Terracidiphilus sp.]|nr:tRNA (adenosine(37)-N6)-threonylcarbamoyltransferase complex dimerization subunit type 1 TsaB [Terracidiphilus sp.]